MLRYSSPVIRPAFLEPGPGCFVMLTVTHMNVAVVRLHLETGELLEPTYWYKLWSADREAWTSTGTLFPGERLQTRNGGVVVERVEKVDGAHRVYNFEVEKEHTYQVGKEGIWSHNARCEAAQARADGKQS